MTENGLASVKCVVVGDGNVGKTCLLWRYTENRFSEQHDPTMFDNYKKEIQVDGLQVELDLWDTAGQEDYENLRPLAYPNTNIILLCFSLAHKISLENALAKWVKEIEQHCSGIPVILVGTKSDLKNDLSGVDVRPEDKVSSREAISVQKEINKRSQVNCCAYFECSAKLQKGVDEVFMQAARCGLNPPPKYSKKSGKCIIL